jgi:hypothetical protein
MFACFSHFFYHKLNIFSSSNSSKSTGIISLYLKLGDKEYNIEDLRKYRTDTDGFDVDYANNGIFGIVEGGPTTAVADGYYIMMIRFKKEIIRSIIDQV